MSYFKTVYNRGVYFSEAKSVALFSRAVTSHTHSGQLIEFLEVRFLSIWFSLVAFHIAIACPI